MGTRRTAALWIAFGAITLAVIGYQLWHTADENAEQDAAAARMTVAIHLDAGRPDLAATVDTEPEPDHTLATLAYVAAAVAAITAGYLLATAPRTPDAPHPDPVP